MEEAVKAPNMAREGIRKTGERWFLWGHKHTLTWQESCEQGNWKTPSAIGEAG